MLISSVLKAKGTHVETARWDVPLGDAARRLAGHRIGALVIVDCSASSRSRTSSVPS